MPCKYFPSQIFTARLLIQGTHSRNKPSYECKQSFPKPKNPDFSKHKALRTVDFGCAKPSKLAGKSAGCRANDFTSCWAHSHLAMNSLRYMKPYVFRTAGVGSRATLLVAIWQALAKVVWAPQLNGHRLQRPAGMPFLPRSRRQVLAFLLGSLAKLFGELALQQSLPAALVDTLSPANP